MHVRGGSWRGAYSFSPSLNCQDLLQLYDRNAPLRTVVVQVKDAQVSHPPRLLLSSFLEDFLDKELRASLDPVFLENVMDPTVRQHTGFDETKVRIEKRARLLLDYDAYRRKVRTLVEKPSENSHALPAKEKKVRALLMAL